MLLAEAGAAEVHVCHRHETPSFTTSDWSWVDDLIARTIEVRGWFRGLAIEAREAIQRLFWKEERLKLEPRLAPRIARPEVRVRPKISVVESARFFGFVRGCPAAARVIVERLRA